MSTGTDPRRRRSHPRPQPGAAGAELDGVDRLVHSFRRAAVVLDTTSQAAQERLGLARSDLAAMELLSTAGTLTAGRLGEELALASGTVTGVIDRLEAQGYAERRVDPDDRRRVVVALTALGRRRHREVFQRRRRWLEELAGEMAAEDLECVVRFLDRAHEFRPAQR